MHVQFPEPLSLHGVRAGGWSGGGVVGAWLQERAAGPLLTRSVRLTSWEPCSRPTHGVKLFNLDCKIVDLEYKLKLWRCLQVFEYF